MAFRNTPCCLSLLILGLNLAPSAQEALQESPASPARAQDDRGASYLLHLTSGQVLRTRARSVDDVWEIRRGKEWIALPPGSVARAALEDDVLEQARRLEKQSRAADPVRRVAYADWLVHAGLHVEALETLDKILDESPDQAEALDLVRRSKLSIALPQAPAHFDDEQAVGQFTSRLARCGTAAREIVIEDLRSQGEIPGLFEAIHGELEHPSPQRRSLAALAFQRLFPGRELRGLLSRAILDSSPDVRARAALALRAAKEPTVVVPALRALGSRYPSVRSNAVEALGLMDYGIAVQPLITHLIALQSSGGTKAPHAHLFVGTQSSYIQDFDVEVAQRESIADPVINVLQEGVVLDAAVQGVTDYVVRRERAATARSLSLLTGVHPGPEVADWETWWQENGEEWLAGLDPHASSPQSPGS